MYRTLETLSNEGTVDSKLDPRANPYLSHHYNDAPDTYGAGGFQNGSRTGSNSMPLNKMRRHKTTAAQGKEAEDGPTNAFTGRPLSQQYFSILKGRRNLPVYAQR